MKLSKAARFALPLLWALLALGCEPKAEPEQVSSSAATSNYIERGDLDALRQRGQLRLLHLQWEQQGLPRSGNRRDSQQDAEQFARSLGLEPVWLSAASYADMRAALLEGRADLIVGNLTQTPSRQAELAFGLPVDRTQELLVTAASAEPITAISQLQGKRIAIRAGSSHQDSLLDFLDQHPELNFELAIIDGRNDPDYLLDHLNRGAYDALVMDSNLLAQLDYRDDYQTGLAISPVRNIAWALRPQNPALRQKLNTYLLENLAKSDWHSTHLDDWDGIVARKTLRVITRNSPSSYFLWRGELMGFEYELMRHFAKRHKLHLQMVVAPPKADLIAWLKQGRGDVIAANLTISDARRDRGIEFSRPYNRAAEQLVSGAQSAPLHKLEDLNGRKLYIHPNNHYWHTAKALQQQGYEFELIALKQSLTTSEVLAAVARGEFDASLIDSHLLDIERQFIDNLQPGLRLQPEHQHGWAVRKESPKLLQRLNSYLRQEVGSEHFNVLKLKYFEDDKKVSKYSGQRLHGDSALSPFDTIVKAAAAQHGFDWRLLTAQMYQESRFNPRARSHRGALGLMQVMPRTAREFGYKLPLNTQTGIEAGAAYLAWCRERFEPHLPPQERLWFALAAYNAGAGHMFDARRLAEQKGLDPNIWFDNVETAMLLLSQPAYYQKARFGYVRGSEPVNYVRQIRKRYLAYLHLDPLTHTESLNSVSASAD